MKILEQNNKKENVPQTNRTGIKEDVNGVLENTKQKLDSYYTDEHKNGDFTEVSKNEKPRFGLEE